MSRGIAPELLLSQVENTAGFIFQDAIVPEPEYLRILKQWRLNPGQEEENLPYYALCLAAHWATAGTYVPTDVDNAIRLKLWKEIPPETTSEMAKLVVAALAWDYSPVTARVVVSPKSGEKMSTHEGTWFSVAVGAYAALKELGSPQMEQVLKAMVEEAAREARILEELHEAGDALGMLKASALVSHNLGDLDRVIDQWELPKDDLLRRELYKAGQPDCARHHPLFAYTGELNTRFVSVENHRHYALRAARCLRRRGDYLLPVGPFFDDWGRILAQSYKKKELTIEEIGEVVRALVDGAGRQVGTFGYSRGLAGILEAFPGGLEGLRNVIPGKDMRLLQAGPLHDAWSLSQERFEARWKNLLRQVKLPKLTSC